MTITSPYVPANFTGSGSTGPFSATFRVLDKTNIKVERIVVATGVVTTLTEGVGAAQYQAVLVAAGLSGVQVTLNTLLAVGERLVISRVTPRTQLERLADLKRFNAEIHERIADKGMMVTQESEYIGSNAILFPTADTPGLTKTLPVDVLRANKVMGFDSLGQPVVTTLNVSDLNGFATALTQAQTAATTATTMAGTATTQAGIATTQAGLAIAAVGSVKVSGTDTTADRLTVKLTNTGSTNILTKTLVGGGGNETLNLAVTEATTSQAETGTNGTTVITPRRLAYLLSAVQPAQTDLNSFALGIFYTANTGMTNLPPNWGQGRYIVETMQISTGSYFSQTIYAVGPGTTSNRSRVAWRTWDGSTWTSWNTGIGAIQTPSTPTIGTATQWTGPDGWMSIQITGNANITGVTKYDVAVGTTNTPTDLLDSGYLYGHSGANWANGEPVHLNFPIRSGDYFKVNRTLVAGNIQTETVTSIKFRPLLAL